MAGTTTYYQLETYESADVPDLRDQYNSSMSKIDTALNSIAGTASSAASGVADAVTNATTALNAAAAAQSSAADAAAAAAEAVATANAASAQISQASTDAEAALTAATNAQLDITTFKQTFPADYPRTDLGTSSLHAYFRCIRGVACLLVNGSADYTGAWTATTIGTIPSGYRFNDLVITNANMDGTRSSGVPRIVIDGATGVITTDGGGVALGSGKTIEAFMTWPVP